MANTAEAAGAADGFLAAECRVLTWRQRTAAPRLTAHRRMRFFCMRIWLSSVSPMQAASSQERMWQCSQAMLGAAKAFRHALHTQGAWLSLRTHKNAVTHSGDAADAGIRPPGGPSRENRGSMVHFGGRAPEMVMLLRGLAQTPWCKRCKLAGLLGQPSTFLQMGHLPELAGAPLVTSCAPLCSSTGSVKAQVDTGGTFGGAQRSTLSQALDSGVYVRLWEIVCRGPVCHMPQLGESDV